MREDTLFPEMDWRGLAAVSTHTKRSCTYENTFLFIEKYVDDIKQDEKHVLDLLESIRRPPGLAKEELQPSLFEMNQFRPEITKTRV